MASVGVGNVQLQGKHAVAVGDGDGVARKGAVQVEANALFVDGNNLIDEFIHVCAACNFDAAVSCVGIS